ncbi:MAG: synthase [Bacteroidota bacterium]
MKIAGATLNQTPLDWTSNVNNIHNAILQAKSEGVRVLCLPELCLTAYGCEDLFLSDWLVEEALSYLPGIVALCENITVCVGLPIRQNKALYNCVCMIHDAEIVGFTAKQFLANDGVHYEPRWFTPWPSEVQEQYEFHGKYYPFGDVIYHLNNICIAFEICEDAWRNEARPGFKHHQKGVHLILNPSASHFSFGKSLLRHELVLQSAALFQCTYLYTNLLGNEAGKIIYDGEILIAQQGKLIQQNTRFSFQSINLVVAEVDCLAPENTPKAILKVDEHDKETEFVKACALALFDYLRKSNSKAFVLSLSGGADSSACAVLVAELIKRGVDELGLALFCATLKRPLCAMETLQKDLLITAYQATKNSGDATLQSASGLAHSLGATFYQWFIDEEVESYTHKIETVLGRKLSWTSDDIALQNIQARGRAPIIWMLTNIVGGLLITTSNRSEGDVGYATMDGDMAGGLAPIAGVDKAYLQEWLRWAEIHLGYTGLQYVNHLQPSAELRPQENVQTDEVDLMPYPIMKAIEIEAIRNRKSPQEVFNALKDKKLEEELVLKNHINKFFRLWSINQWKRERTAPSFLLDDFNVDPRSWCRFPILNGGFHTVK